MERWVGVEERESMRRSEKMVMMTKIKGVEKVMRVVVAVVEVVVGGG